MKRNLIPLLIRISSQFLSFLIPLLVLKFYSIEIYGVVVVLIGLQAINALLDWGKQIPFQNRISKIGLTEYSVFNWLFKQTKFNYLLIINVLVGVLAMYTYPYWINFIIGDASNAIIITYRHTINYVIISSCLYGALFCSDSILIGLGYIQNKYLLDFISSLVVLFTLLVFVLTKVDLIYVLDCALSVPVANRIASTVYVLLKGNKLKRKDYLGNISTYNSGISLSKLSIMFLYLQILSLLANNIDSLYLANNVKIGLSEIGKFGFYIKIFGISILIINLLNSIKAPEISANAYSKIGKYAFPIFKKLLKNNLLISILFSLLVLMFLPIILKIFGKTDLLDYSFAFVITIQMIILYIRNSFTVYINSAELMVSNILGNTVFSFFQIMLKVFLIIYFGIYGIPLSNIFGYLIFLLPFHVFALKQHKTKYNKVIY